jgi:membrane protease YdiL (CAAX protease family)
MPPMVEHDPTTETHGGNKRILALVVFVASAAAGLLLPTQGVISSVCLVYLFLSGCILLQLDMTAPALSILFLILAYLTRLLPFYSLGLMLLAPLVVFIAVCGLVETLRPGISWLRRGRITPRGLLIGLAVVVVSGVSLVVWYRLFNPDISEFIVYLPRNSGLVLPAAALAFSVTNALVEEFIYRGVLWEGLHDITGRWEAALVVQALVFGVAHWWGVPNGVVGVCLATIYGLMMGAVRYISRGLLLPIVVHVFADIVIFALLLDMAGRLGG